jgi:hypothetical protein
MEMIIHSRISDETWEGAVEKVDYKSPNQSENEDDDARSNASSKYPFYVHLGELNGLMIGQHVYMTPKEEINEDIVLPSNFVYENEYIWIDANGVLIKKKIDATYNESDDTYIITNGITDDDLIAIAKEYEEGTPTTFVPPTETKNNNTTNTNNGLLVNEEFTDDEYDDYEDFGGYNANDDFNDFDDFEDDEDFGDDYDEDFDDE